MPTYFLVILMDELGRKIGQVAESPNPDDACAKVLEQWPGYRVWRISPCTPKSRDAK